MAANSVEIRFTVASSRYHRLVLMSRITNQLPSDLVKLAIDDYYNRLLLSGVIMPFVQDSDAQKKVP